MVIRRAAAFCLPFRCPAGCGRVGVCAFHAPLFPGEEITKTSTILKVEAKSGKSGNLVFVTVRHELSASGKLAVSEEQDIVYREAAASGPALPAAAPAPDAPWRHSINPDTVLLFRYSALTMNGHRIHYDRPYACGEEAYPALVVHGPLQATLLAALATRNLSAPVSTFYFRGSAPAFDGVPLHFCGEPTAGGASLWSEQGGVKNMVATVGVG